MTRADSKESPQERYEKVSDAELGRLNETAEEQARYSDDETVNRIAFDSRAEIKRRGKRYTITSQEDKDRNWERMLELVKKRNLTLEEREEKRLRTAADIDYLKSRGVEIGLNLC